MKTRSIVIAITSAAALTATAWTTAAARPPGPRLLQLDAKFQQAKTVDVAPHGPSLGDEQVVSGVLRNGNGNGVGQFGFVCTLVGVSHNATLEHCAGWGTLRQGQITVAGMSAGQDNRHTWSITGGTGTYRQARGEVHIDDLSSTESRIVLQLR
jgi:hypothetical protein